MSKTIAAVSKAQYQEENKAKNSNTIPSMKVVSDKK
jgi:hypothetical protein